MAGYWPSSVFCVFMDRDDVEVHKNAKKERGQYPATFTEQAKSIKDLLFGFRENVLSGYSELSPERSILPPPRGRKGGGGGTPYNGLYVEAPPERGTFFRLEIGCLGI